MSAEGLVDEVRLLLCALCASAYPQTQVPQVHQKKKKNRGGLIIQFDEDARKCDTLSLYLSSV